SPVFVTERLLVFASASRFLARVSHALDPRTNPALPASTDRPNPAPRQAMESRRLANRRHRSSVPPLRRPLGNRRRVSPPAYSRNAVRRKYSRTGSNPPRYRFGHDSPPAARSGRSDDRRRFPFLFSGRSHFGNGNIRRVFRHRVVARPRLPDAGLPKKSQARARSQNLPPRQRHRRRGSETRLSPKYPVSLLERIRPSCLVRADP